MSTLDLSLLVLCLIWQGLAVWSLRRAAKDMRKAQVLVDNAVEILERKTGDYEIDWSRVISDISKV